jgi:hypothetical protein
MTIAASRIGWKAIQPPIAGDGRRPGECRIDLGPIDGLRTGSGNR